jgi:hypothetical protein
MKLDTWINFFNHFYYIIHYRKHYFPHTLQGKCIELQRTLHNSLHWFLISIHPFLSYTYNTNERKQKKNMLIN